MNKDLLTFVDRIPLADTTPLSRECGTLEAITYSSKDYFGDGSELKKPAFVYLPYEYDSTEKYNVLYLMHGIGGNEREWGMCDSSSKIKAIMDNLIRNKEIEPFIVVVPNGRSGADFANTQSDFHSFYYFGKELRNDLIPYIDSHYSTFADYHENGYDLTKARQHRAMAGLSMGGMQTINIGMCEGLDMISYFGAFSAAPTSYPSDELAKKLNDFKDYNINYFYNICGTDDGIAFASASAAVNDLTIKTDHLGEDNFMWQTLPGGHDFDIWYLGFYNFVKLVFK